MTKANKLRVLHLAIDHAKREAKKYERMADKAWETEKTENILAYASAQARAEGFADGIRHALEMLGETRP